MKPLISAKQLTIRYFSIIAVAIIAVHASVFELTTDDLEYAYAQNRLDNIKEFALLDIQAKNIREFEALEQLIPGKIEFDETSSVIFNFNQLPDIFPAINDLPYNKAVEIDNEASQQTYYVMKINTNKEDLTRDALLVIDNRLYELSEEQLLFAHTKQITITLILILLSLLIVIRISKKLTLPVATFSQALSSQNPADFNILSLPKEAQTKELENMLSTFNRYQSQIQLLIERERSFNRYASHELRSPLMVMKGAITLLGESTDKAFLKRQHQRLDKAANEMSEFVETLLSLTKPVNNEEQNAIFIDKKLVNNIVENHTHLIKHKSVTWEVNILESFSVNVPEAAFHILLGNLVKNAFAYTDNGSVVIEVSAEQLRVIDTGKGFKSKSEKVDGYGLGLLLVQDICRKYGHKFKLSTNNEKGAIATVHFASL